MLFCTITLLIPLRATILAFMIGSVIASKSIQIIKKKKNPVKTKTLQLLDCATFRQFILDHLMRLDLIQVI